MGTIASQITSLTIVYSTVYSDTDQRKHQSSVSLVFVQMARNAENVSIWWRHHDWLSLTFRAVGGRMDAQFIVVCVRDYLSRSPTKGD